MHVFLEILAEKSSYTMWFSHSFITTEISVDLEIHSYLQQQRSEKRLDLCVVRLDAA